MKVRKLIYCLTFVYILIALFTNKAYATPDSCTATVTPSSVVKNTSNTFTFTIQNTSSVPYNDIKITRPGATLWTITGGEGTGWTSTVNSNDVTFYNGTLSVSSSSDFSVIASVANFTSDSTSWGVQASDDDGGSYFTCTGSLGTSVVSPPEGDPPQVITVSVSSIAASSVNVSWTTDKSTIGYVDYGLTEEYGSRVSDLTYSDSHTVTLSSLTANTKYHFNVSVEDTGGLTGQWGDEDFVTALTGQTKETITVTKTLTPTPTPTPVPDTTKPAVTVSTNFSKPFQTSPQVVGRVTDNKGVSKVEYSVDNGKNWLPVTLSALNKTAISFSFIPNVKEDGNYDFLVRATDISGNIGVSKKQILVIDRLHPQVSGVIYSIGPFLLTPKGGEILVSDNQVFKITLSDVGGATSIDVFVDDTKKPDSKKIVLTKNSDNNLWSGNININKEGEYQLRFSAIDGAGNITDRNLNRVNVVKRGKVNANNAKITVHFFNTVTNEWKIWDGLAYGQKNPLKADKNGEYSLFLPAGRYYLEIEGYGFQTQTTEFFSLEKSQPINIDFPLKPLKLIVDLKIFKLYWPDFSTLTVPFKNNLAEIIFSENKLIGKELPFFSLESGFRSTSLTGKQSVLTFLNTWSPSSTEQVSVLNNFSKNKVFNSVTIIVGEKQSKVSVFQKRGGYDLKMYADPDAMLTDKFELSILPTHFFLDKRGVVKEIVSGVISEQEIKNILNK